MMSLRSWRRPAAIAGATVLLVLLAVVAGTRLLSGTGDTGPVEPQEGKSNEVSSDSPVQKAVNAKCRKGGVVQLSGTYETNETISVERCKGLTIKGPATLDGSAEGRAREARHVSIRNSSDIVVEDITVIGGRCVRPCENPEGGGLAAHERQHGFEIAASRNVELRRVVARNIWGDGVYVTAKTFADNLEKSPSGIVVRDSYIDNSGRQGIAVAGVDGMVVERTVVRLANRSVFDFEAESGGARDFTLRDSHIVSPDNATLNISCKDDDSGQMLNKGPFLLVGNRVYGDRLKVNPFNCDLPEGMVVLEGNLGSLPVDQAPLLP
ncbi:MAG: hypothetical protein ACRDV9_07205 [Acidimicrobiia bacterium]